MKKNISDFNPSTFVGGWIKKDFDIVLFSMNNKKRDLLRKQQIPFYSGSLKPGQIAYVLIVFLRQHHQLAVYNPVKFILIMSLLI